MPFYETSPWAAASSAAAGWVAEQQARRQQAIQNEQLHQQAMAQALAMTRTTFEEGRESRQDRINQGLDPNTGQPYVPGVPAPKPGASDGEMADWARATSLAAMHVGNASAANYYKGIADSYDTGAYREAETRYTTQGRLPLAQAQTKNVDGLFEQQIRLANIHLTGQERIAAMRALHAGVRARAGGYNRRNPAEAEYVSSLRAIGSEEVRMATQAAVDQYTQGERNYRSSFDQNGQPTMAEPQLQMPTIKITTVTSPSGDRMPFPIVVYPNQQGAPSRPRSTPAARHSAPPPAPAGQSLLQRVEGSPAWLMHTLFGGGQPTRQVGGRTYYQHSDGKWYLTP